MKFERGTSFEVPTAPEVTPQGEVPNPFEQESHNVELERGELPALELPSDTEDALPLLELPTESFEELPILELPIDPDTENNDPVAHDSIDDNRIRKNAEAVDSDSGFGKKEEKLEQDSTKTSGNPTSEGVEPNGDVSGADDAKDVKEPIKNKIDGLAREKEVSDELNEKYPPEKGYQVVSEAYLRDKDGNIVKDPISGTARRIDFVVVKDGKVVDSIEVTSKTADKTEQSAKEERIREAGGNYIRDNDGNLVEIPSYVQTHIERRD